MAANRRVRVRDISVFIKGKKPSVVFDAPVVGAQPYILIEGFSGRYTKYTNDLGSVRCEVGDTLVVADGANTGLASTGHEGYLGSTLGALRPKHDQINPRYLYFFIKSKFHILNTVTRGAAVPHLEQDLLLDLEFALPSLGEQRRIVRILDKASELSSLRYEASQRAGKLIEALFINTFWQAGDRRNWKTETVESLADPSRGSIRTGPFGSQLLHSEFTASGIPVLAIDNVVENEFRWTSPRCISPERFEDFSRFQVFPGDVLVTIMGTVGRCCVAPDDLPVCISTKHLCVITLRLDRVQPRFLWASLLYDPEVGKQTKGAGGGAVMEGWNSTIIREIAVRVPPMKLQRDFSARVVAIRALESAQARSKVRLNDLSQSLLHRAFRGEL